MQFIDSGSSVIFVNLPTHNLTLTSSIVMGLGNFMQIKTHNVAKS